MRFRCVRTQPTARLKIALLWRRRGCLGARRRRRWQWVRARGASICRHGVLFFKGVFDGHGGSACAEFLRHELVAAAQSSVRSLVWRLRLHGVW